MKLSEEQIIAAFTQVADQKKVHETLGIPEQNMKNYRYLLKKGTLRIGTMLEILNLAGKLEIKS